MKIFFHVICLVYCLHLIGEVLCSNVPRLDDFVAKMKTAFCQSVAIRRVYVEPLVQVGADNPLSLSSPVVTRWYSWLTAVQVLCGLYFNAINGQLFWLNLSVIHGVKS